MDRSRRRRSGERPREEVWRGDVDGEDEDEDEEDEEGRIEAGDDDDGDEDEEDGEDKGPPTPRFLGVVTAARPPIEDRRATTAVAVAAEAAAATTIRGLLVPSRSKDASLSTPLPLRRGEEAEIGSAAIFVCSTSRATAADSYGHPSLSPTDVKTDSLPAREANLTRARLRRTRGTIRRRYSQSNPPAEPRALRTSSPALGQSCAFRPDLSILPLYW